MATASASDNAIEGTARWSLRLFGGFELSALPGGEKVALPGKRERVLLAYLALSPNCRQPRRKLAALLWGDATDETLLDNLRACVWKLRKALDDTEHGLIASEGEDIVFDAAAFDVDVLAFRLLASQSGRSKLEEAAKLYCGEFLDGLDVDSEEFESWRRAEMARYRDQAIDVLTRLMTQLSEGGETERAIETGLRILRLEPLHEAAIRRLMRLYGASGRRGAAVQLYRMLADALKTELGAQPEAETRAVFAEIARGGEDLTSAPAASAAPAAADAKPPARSMVTAVPSDAPAEPPPPAQQLAPVIGAPQRAKTRKLNWILAGGLAAVIALFLFYEFVPTRTGQDGQTGLAAARGASSTQAGAVSIAVLPFVNLSGDTAQEFFSDGMTEEITSALAKIADLRVVGRTSAFQFKGEKKDLRAIGQALGATHLLEGSVRKEGDRVRITTELVQAANGVNVWSENYDRQLTGVFAIQEDIATAIAQALRMPLGLKQGEQLVANRGIDAESYGQYLQAKALVRNRTALKPLVDAAAILEQVVAGNPDFAPGWALLASDYAYTPLLYPAWRNGSVDELRHVVDVSLPKAQAAGQRAIQLDPNLALGYLGSALAQSARGKFVLADDLYSKALALDPGNPDALHSYSLMLASVGHLKEALAIRHQLQTLEPFAPTFNTATAEVLWLNGQNDAAIAMLKAIPEYNTSARNLAFVLATEGHYNEAADALLKISPGAFAPGTVEEAARLLRTAPARAVSPQTLPRLGGLGFVYPYVGAPNRVLEFHEDNIKAGYSLGANTSLLWQPSYATVRKTERFKTYARKAGLVEYWRAKGWPEQCHPTTGDDFVCV